MNDIFNDMQVEVGCEKLLLLTAYFSLRDSLKTAVLFHLKKGVETKT